MSTESKGKGDPPRNSPGRRIPSFPVRRGLLDGIVWTAVGVTLVVHAGVIATMGWIEGEPSGTSSASAQMLRVLIAIAFACVGGGALYLGARRFRSNPPEAQ